MAADTETLETIRRWAEAEFPDSFRLFSNYTGIDRRSFRVEDRIVRGRRIEERKLMTAVRVSDYCGVRRPVYTWAEIDGTVNLGHLESDSNGGYMAEHIDCTDLSVRFGRPFCWVQPAADETGAARFEALVRYYVRVSCKDASGIRARKTASRDHFPAACRDVAAGMRARARGKGNVKGNYDRCTRLSTLSLTPRDSKTADVLVQGCRQHNCRSSRKVALSPPSQRPRHHCLQHPQSPPSRQKLLKSRLVWSAKSHILRPPSQTQTSLPWTRPSPASEMH